MRNLDKAINKLLNGASAREIVEDLGRVAAHTVAALMVQGMSKDAAIQKVVDMTGFIPDEDLLHILTAEKFGQAKEGEIAPLQHWIKMGHHNPSFTPKKGNT